MLPSISDLIDDLITDLDQSETFSSDILDSLKSLLIDIANCKPSLCPLDALYHLQRSLELIGSQWIRKETVIVICGPSRVHACSHENLDSNKSLRSEKTLAMQHIKKCIQQCIDIYENSDSDTVIDSTDNNENDTVDSHENDTDDDSCDCCNNDDVNDEYYNKCTAFKAHMEKTGCPNTVQCNKNMQQSKPDKIIKAMATVIATVTNTK